MSKSEGFITQVTAEVSYSVTLTRCADASCSAGTAILQFSWHEWMGLETSVYNTAFGDPGPFYFPPMSGDQFLRTVWQQARPTVCGGGVFGYLGAQGKTKGGTGGFIGYLGEWDSNLGYSHNVLGEVGGEHVAVGGAVNKEGVESFLFIPAGEIAGGVIGPGAIGGYVGTPEKLPVGIGGGSYLNVVPAATCRELQSRKR